MARLWAVGSGKGGVGKSFFVSSLGISLARMNRRTLLIDFDLSGPNLHSTLGESLSPNSLDHFFSGTKRIGDLAQATQFLNLYLVQGSQFSVENRIEMLRSLVEECRTLPFNEIIFDLGPGSQETYLELMNLTDERIFVVTPEPPSLEKNYRLIEKFYIYGLKCAHSNRSDQNLIQALERYKTLQKPNSLSFREHLKTEVGWKSATEQEQSASAIHLVVNQIRGDEDQILGSSIRTICRQFLGIKVNLMESLIYDNAVWQSYRSIEPMLMKYPYSPLAGQFQKIAKALYRSEINSQFATPIV